MDLPVPPLETRSAWRLPLEPPIVAVYLGLATMLVLLHAYQVNFEPRTSGLRVTRHQQIVIGQAKAPFGYRIAVPHAAGAIGHALSAMGVKPVRALELGYLGLRWLFVFSALLLFHAFLATWLPPPWVLAGVFLFAALHPPSFLFYWYQPASALDLSLWLAAALISLRDRSGWWLVPLVGLGALNRETVVFVVAIHFALRFGKEPLPGLVLRCAAIGLAWAGVFLGLRVAIGVQPMIASVTSIFEENFASPMWWVYAAAFFGALWLLPFRHWRSQPAELRRLLVVLVPYFLLQLVFGRVREVRLFLPLALPLIPLALCELRRVTEGVTSTEEGPTWSQGL